MVAASIPVKLETVEGATESGTVRDVMTDGASDAARLWPKYPASPELWRRRSSPRRLDGGAENGDGSSDNGVGAAAPATMGLPGPVKPNPTACQSLVVVVDAALRYEVPW